MGWRTGRCGASLCRNAGQRSMGQQADLQRQHIHLHGGDEPRDRAPHMVAEAAWNCHPVQVTRKRFMDVASESRAVLLHKGFMMASWEDCVDAGFRRTQNLDGIDQLAEALRGCLFVPIMDMFVRRSVLRKCCRLRCRMMHDATPEEMWAH